MPIPTDLSLPKAISSTVDQLAKLEMSGGAVPPGKMGRYNKLADQLAELADLSVTLSQREGRDGAQGAIQWHSNFIRMRDVSLLLRIEALHPRACLVPLSPTVRTELKAFFAPAGEGRLAVVLPTVGGGAESIAKSVAKVRAKLWQGLPASRFKLFQEAFSTELNYTVPTMVCEQRALDRCSLSACLVSPDLLPNKLASDLRLVDFGARSTRLEALQKKQAPAVIDGLKALWESLELLDSSNKHLFGIAQHSEETRSRYPGIAEIPEEILGSILYTRERVSGSSRRAFEAMKRGEYEPRSVTVSFFSSSYSMHRKTMEEKAGYQSEVRELATLSERWKTINTEFNEGWRKATPTRDREEMKNQLIELLGESRELLERSSNLQKGKARMMLSKIEDSLAEPLANPDLVIARTGPLLTRMVSAISAFKERSHEVKHKSKWNEDDQTVLEHLIALNEAKFDFLSSAFAQMDLVLKNNRGYFRQRNVDLASRERFATSLIGQLKLRLPDFDKTSVRPFRAFSQKMLAIRDNMRQAIVDQDAQKTADAAVKLVCVWKLAQVNSACEWLRTEMIPGAGVNVAALAKRARKLKETVEARKVLPKCDVDAYRGPFDEIQAFVKSLVRGLEHHEGRGMTGEQQEQLFERIRDFLDQKDLEKIVRDLPV